MLGEMRKNMRNAGCWRQVWYVELRSVCGLDYVPVGESDFEAIGGGCFVCARTGNLQEVTGTTQICYGLV